MKVICEHCQQKIDSDNLNIAKDIGYCSNCENVTTLSTLVSSSASKSFDPNRPVRGIKITDQPHSWSIEARHLDPSLLLFLPLTLIWVSVCLGSLFDEIEQGPLSFDQLLADIPFLIVSLILLTVTLMTLFGCTKFGNDNGKAFIFIGIGAIGWTQRFEWRAIDRVCESKPYEKRSTSLENPSTINLGWDLNTRKRYFVMNFLQSKLKK